MFNIARNRPIAGNIASNIASNIAWCGCLHGFPAIFEHVAQCGWVSNTVASNIAACNIDVDAP